MRLPPSAAAFITVKLYGGSKVRPEHDFKLLLQAGAPQAAIGEISGFNWTQKEDKWVENKMF